jgi:hypothetical protein
MIEELKRIEDILKANQEAEAPGLPKNSNDEEPKQEAPVNQQAIKEAENQSKELANQMVSVNANLEALLSEVQGLSATLHSLTG